MPLRSADYFPNSDFIGTFERIGSRKIDVIELADD